MHFCTLYNIHVCISKGNVVNEAHLILLQLNCKDRYGTFATEHDYDIILQSTTKLHFECCVEPLLMMAFKPPL